MRIEASREQPAAGSRAWRGSFGMTLAVAMGIGTFPAYVFGALGPFLITEYALSRSQLGLLTTVFFGVGGALSVVAGPLVDRVGGRAVMLGSFVVMGAALVGMVVAPSYPVLVAAAVVAGLSLATGNPTTNKLISVHIPLGRRGVVMGVKQSGVQGGAFLAGAVLPTLAATWGWRAALLGSMMLPLSGLVAALRVIPPDEQRRSIAARRAAPAVPPAVWWLTVYAFLMGSGVAAVGAYLPLFAVERLSFSPQAAGAVAAAMALVGVVSRIAWGWGSERWGRYSGPLLAMGAGAAAGTVLLLLAGGGAGYLVWPAGILLGMTAVTWNSVGMLAVVGEAGPAAAGTASGYVLGGFYGGFVASPMVFGAIVDRTTSYATAWALTGAVFAAAAVVVFLWRASPAGRPEGTR